MLYAPVDPSDAPDISRAAERSGRLTPAWQIMVGVTWAAAFFAYAATWKVSEEVGIGTWWLGPRAAPTSLVIRAIPFALAIAMVMTATYNVRRVALISIGGSLAAAAIAAFDTTRSGGLAAIEFTIAGAVMLVSLAALTGTYRSQPCSVASSTGHSQP